MNNLTKNHPVPSRNKTARFYHALKSGTGAYSDRQQPDNLLKYRKSRPRICFLIPKNLALTAKTQ